MIQNEIEGVPTPAIRILVVEDDMLIRFVISDALRDIEGADVIEAATADEAWEYLVTEKGYVDLVFTDHRMPGNLSGAQLAARVKEHYPAIGVVVTSGFYDGTEWAEPVLKKPYDIDRTVMNLIALAKEGQARR